MKRLPFFMILGLLFAGSLVSCVASDTTPAKETKSKAETAPFLDTKQTEKETEPTFSHIKMNVIGDSITYGAYTAPGDEGPQSRVEKPWCDLLGEKLGFSEVNNYGMSGTSISMTSPVLRFDAFSLRYAAMSGDADLILVAGGSNDFGTGVKLGTADDKTDVSFCGALRMLCEGLKKKYPDAMIVFITPITRADEAQNEIGLSLDQYRATIAEIAGGIYGFSVIDGSVIGFAADPGQYLSDGVHPTPEGHQLYADAVAEQLVPLLTQGRM